MSQSNFEALFFLCSKKINHIKKIRIIIQKVSNLKPYKQVLSLYRLR